MANGNPGFQKATLAAMAVGAKLAIPEFGEPRPEGATDFNDMAQHCGAEAVKRAIEAAIAGEIPAHQPGKENPPKVDVEAWPDPQPLAAKVNPEPYPLDALPAAIQAAIIEVQGFTKAPIPMVASSALAALSLAAQPHADVKRADKLTGPTSLFLLTIADSGERKSTCDGFFTRAIKDYEAKQVDLAKPFVKQYKAAVGAWESKCSGVKEQIKNNAKRNIDTRADERRLCDLENEKPIAPRVPQLFFHDATPQALAHELAKRWPSGGVVSAEAGIVFGGHGMKSDSVMQNLATLNQLWDGNTITVHRKTTESFSVRGARLTMALQVQEPTLREFFNQSGALARGTGFLARFLIGWPESTQGNRPFAEPPESWPHLAEFNRRISELLYQTIAIDEEGALNPPMLSMTADAKAAWVEYHDGIERELSGGGDYYDVRDVASKSADNAARMAALFQIYEGGSAISLEAFESASLITAWHLHESRRFFGELALPVEMADAVRLDSWLIEHCKRERTLLVSTRDAQQRGPVRDKERLEQALRDLQELDRLRVTRDERQRNIRVNPALIGLAS